MSIKTNRFNPQITALTIFFVVATVAYPISSLESRKLDESIAPGDPGVKCNPSCIPSPPPPSPPPPSPPPPCPPPPELPPPTPKKPPTKYCPPPPSPPSFIYITGPPGSLYPVDQDFGGASRNLEVGLLGLVCGFLILVAF
ncbi:PREDICTED: leucine-rich repeat extensin-like protein 3 [Theobroma cacao]|uniref:Leucine-rich repeat extensin-like protein 3 n=1 Tax=Theobroma cacao TaxID=3641 RepID=A0AB32VRV9_THECC|nr:PREDICTED: leucine-rich repeat extensin-like protein 3 [Theobroma cacao]